MPDLRQLTEVISQSHKTLFILCGHPYAGKSFIANQLLKRTDMEYVSIDYIFHARGFDWNTNRLPTEGEWEDIFEESYAKARNALRTGNNVLYDSTNQTVASRERLRAVAASEGASTCVVYVKTSVQTVWKRWEENNRESTRPVVSRELVQMTIDSFEEPTESEQVIIIQN